MEIAKEGGYLFTRGLFDCFLGIYKLLKNFIFCHNYELSRENVERISVRDSHCQGNVRSKLCECFAFGLYFVLSFVIFNCFLLQSVFIQLVEWDGEDVDAFSVKILRFILHSMFFILWILPLFCLNKFLNFNWYQNIANSVLLISGQKKYEDIKISDFYADQIKSLVLQMTFCVQGCVIYLPSCINYCLAFINCPLLPTLPWYVEEGWYIFHCALLSSLYAFEYKWVYTGWPLHRRLLNIATKWPYYLGFGSILALINYCFSSFILNLIVFATLFPVYVISSAVTQDRQCPVFRYPFHIFKFADYLSDWFIKLVMMGLNTALGRT